MSSAVTRNHSRRLERALLRGLQSPTPAARPLGGERLSALLEGADLRTVRSCGVTLISRIYAAVRDRHWGTVQPRSLAVEVDGQTAPVEVRWRASYDEPGIQLDAEGEYRIDDTGRLLATFRARVHDDLTYNRIGFCLLLPPSEFAGRSLVADGSTRYELPKDIAPQRIVNGLPAPIFPAVSSLALRGRSGASLRLEFEGDLFEVEDQRNWTDDSFKVYSTPLALGFPHTASAGSPIEQRILITVEPPQVVSKTASAPVAITLGEGLRRPIPRLGFAMASGNPAIDPATLDLLRAARPDHLRLSLVSADDQLERALALVDTLDASLQIEVPADSDAAAETLGDIVDSTPTARARIGDIIVFNGSTIAATTGEDVTRVRERLAPQLPTTKFHGGTRGDFCELNRGGLATEGMDGIAYAIQPQAHAFDDASLFETLAVQAETAANARRLFPGLRLLVGPVTLRARSDAPAPSADRLPASVDDRQLSLLAAAWTLGSLSQLAAAGPDSITYYETVGWRGLIEAASGSPQPDLFPSTPGDPFPLYHVLADAREMSGPMVATSSSDPLACVALAVEDGTRLTVLVANLVPKPVEVEIAPLQTGSYRLRRLNLETAQAAGSNPNDFRSAWEHIDVKRTSLRMRLEPYATARLEAA